MILASSTRFVRYLEDMRRNTIRTRNQRVACLHTFFPYLARRALELLHNLDNLREGAKRSDTDASPPKRSPAALFFLAVRPARKRLLVR